VAVFRVVLWVVMLACLGAFVLQSRNAPGGAVSPGLVVLTLPFQVASVAMLALFWVGPFPPAWPLVGRSRRGVGFWWALAVLGLFWAYFYVAFVFGS
jgi:hypothetical protein